MLSLANASDINWVNRLNMSVVVKFYTNHGGWVEILYSAQLDSANQHTNFYRNRTSLLAKVVFIEKQADAGLRIRGTCRP